MTDVPYLSVVIPAFNEESRIGRSLDTLLKYLESQAYSWEIMVVDDGSTDRTAELVTDRASEHPRILLKSMPHAGKGWAVRCGMLATSGTLRFMCDADLAMPVEQIDLFVQRIQEGFDIVIGSREVPGARRFDEPLVRHLRGRVFNWVVRSVAVRGFDDTQCGFKCFRGDLAEDLFQLQRIKGFGFDVEILYMATQWGCRVDELPIDWYHQADSKVRDGIDSFAMARDTLRVRLNGLKGAYDIGKVRSLTD